MNSNINGRVLLTEAGFWKPGPLYLVDCTTGSKALIDHGMCFGACFSPDGEQIAYCQEGALYTIGIDGTGKTRLTFIVAPTYLNWIADGFIYFSSRFDHALYRVKPAEPLRELVFISQRHNLSNLSLSQDGRRAAWTTIMYTHGEKPKHKVAWWDLVTTKMPEPEIADSFHGSVSPDGERFTRAIPGHREIVVHRFSDGTEEARITPPNNARCNGSRFAQHAKDCIVYSLFDSLEAHVHDLRENRAAPVGRGVITDYFSPLA